MFDTYAELIKELALDIDNKKLWEKALRHKSESQIFIDINKQVAKWRKKY